MNKAQQQNKLSTESKAKQSHPQARLRLDPHTEASTHKPYAVLQSVFLSWFLQPTHMHYFIFLQMKSLVVRKLFAKK